MTKTLDVYVFTSKRGLTLFIKNLFWKVDLCGIGQCDYCEQLETISNNFGKELKKYTISNFTNINDTKYQFIVGLKQIN